MASFNVRQQAVRTLVQGIFLFPFSSGDREADSGQTPGSTMLSVLPPKENLAQICPKLPSLWLSFLKKQTTKRQKKNLHCVLSAVGALTTEAAALSWEAAPALLHGRVGWRVGVGGITRVVPLMLETFTRVTRGENRALFMSGGEGGREPGGICFARPLRRELSRTFQKLGGDSLRRQLK